MQKTTTRDLTRRIAMRTGMRRDKVDRIVDQFMDEVVIEMRARNRIELRQYGTFTVAVCKAYTAVDPKTGQTVQYPERPFVKFKAARRVRGLLMDGVDVEDEV